MGEIAVFVDGMTSRRAVREVTARLRDVPGVTTVSAEADAGVVRLAGSMRVADVLKVLDGTAYRARLDTSGVGDSAGTEGGKPRP